MSSDTLRVVTLYNCDTCDFHTMLKNSFDTHKRKHMEELNKNIFECTICEKSFMSKNGLNHHNQNIHEGIRYECDVCQLTFVSKAYLAFHKESKHTSGENPILAKCDLCEATLSSKNMLKRHKQTVHEPIKKWYHCDQCNFKTKTSSHLNEHKYTHSTETPFKCEICFKSFKSTIHVKAHFKYMHETTQKLNKCELCGYSAKTDNNLKKHVRGVHMGLKPFKCNDCEKSYQCSAHLQRHRKLSHIPKEEQALYQCSNCNYNSVDKEYLKKHVARNHRL